MDFTEQGYQVHVVADATISRSQEDRMLALEVCEFLITIINHCIDVVYDYIFIVENEKYGSNNYYQRECYIQIG